MHYKRSGGAALLAFYEGCFAVLRSGDESSVRTLSPRAARHVVMFAGEMSFSFSVDWRGLFCAALFSSAFYIVAKLFICIS